MTFEGHLPEYLNFPKFGVQRRSQDSNCTGTRHAFSNEYEYLHWYFVTTLGVDMGEIIQNKCLKQSSVHRSLKFTFSIT